MFWPVVATMTFGPPGGKQFPNTGHEIDRAARKLQEAGACGLGANCGIGPEPLVETVRILRSASGVSRAMCVSEIWAMIMLL